VGRTDLTLRPDQGSARVVSVDVQPGGMALVTAPMAKANSAEEAP
jgi:hypothetical protein